jgi:hypothetical protein
VTRADEQQEKIKKHQALLRKARNRNWAAGGALTAFVVGVYQWCFHVSRNDNFDDAEIQAIQKEIDDEMAEQAVLGTK